MSGGARLSDLLLERALPVAARALASAGELARRSRARSSEAMVALLGEDFEARVDAVRANVGERGIDPFGLDGRSGPSPARRCCTGSGSAPRSTASIGCRQGA